ncbi:MAG: hypothetical protein HKN05_02690 [Rhizobiales bacterium]|nr:hypothetical protein [Hyphomicrobiales bacterium]
MEITRSTQRDGEKTISQGGEVRREKFEISGFGTMAVVLDNTGAGFGVIEPAPH